MRILSTSGDLTFVAGGNVKVGANNVLDASAIGSSVQGYNAALGQIAGLTPTTNQILKYNGSAWAASSDSDAVNTVDDVSLAVDGNYVWSVKAGGISTAKVADGAITSGKLASGAVGASQVDTGVIPLLSSSNVFTNELNTFKEITSTRVNLQGASQSGFAVSRTFEIQTTDDTPDVSAAVTLDADGTTFSEAWVTVCDDTNGDSAAYHLYSVDNRMSGVSNGNAVSKSKQDEVIHEDTNLANCLCAFNLSSNSLRVSCTGIASVNLRWHIVFAYRVAPKYAA